MNCLGAVLKIPSEKMKHSTLKEFKLLSYTAYSSVKSLTSLFGRLQTTVAFPPLSWFETAPVYNLIIMNYGF